jgi:hypothetical protein
MKWLKMRQQLCQTEAGQPWRITIIIIIVIIIGGGEMPIYKKIETSAGGRQKVRHHSTAWLCGVLVRDMDDCTRTVMERRGFYGLTDVTAGFPRNKRLCSTDVISRNAVWQTALLDWWNCYPYVTRHILTWNYLSRPIVSTLIRISLLSAFEILQMYGNLLCFI